MPFVSILLIELNWKAFHKSGRERYSWAESDWFSGCNCWNPRERYQGGVLPLGVCWLLEQRWTVLCGWSFVSGETFSMMKVGWYSFISYTRESAENASFLFLPNTFKDSLSTSSASPALNKTHNLVVVLARLHLHKAKCAERKAVETDHVTLECGIIIWILLCSLWLVGKKKVIFYLLIQALVCLAFTLVLVLKDCKVVFPDISPEAFYSCFHRMLVSFLQYLMLMLNSYISFFYIAADISVSK